MPEPTTNAPPKAFVISRVFDAPRALLWKCFTEVDRLKQWWGPKGFTVITAQLDLHPGGTFHYAMKAPNGTVMWGKFSYREVKAPEWIAFINAFSDEAGGTTRHPMHATWPLEMRSIFSFEDTPDGKTKFTLRWSPHNASAEEQETFEAGHDSMTQGWRGTMDQLEAYLAKTK
jgi:uncharacterized protein YndB with AHSA1/START domain